MCGRRGRSWFASAVVAAGALVTLWAVPAAPAATTLSLPPVTTLPPVTALPPTTLPPVTTFSVTTITSGTGATASPSSTTTAQVTGTTAAGPLGVQPAAAGFVAVNPGLSTSDMGVQIWPEYDSTDVLVMVDFILDGSPALPLTLSFYAPKGARLSGLAEIDGNGQFVYDKKPVTTQGTEFDKVSFSVNTYRHLRIEYYYDPGLGQDLVRSFVVSFQAPVDTGTLTVSVQQPLRSSGLTVQPALGVPSTDSQGFTSTQGVFTGLKEGQRLNLQVGYTKSDARPSVETTTTTAQTAAAESGSSGAKWLIWLGAIVIVVVGGILIWTLLKPKGPGAGSGAAAVRKGTSASSGRNVRPKESRDASARAGSGGGGPKRFCTECGNKMQKDNRFCPVCGHQREEDA
jgi:hypothetical protein